MTRDLITNSPFELFKLLEDPKFEKGPVEMISPELFAVPYRSLSDFVESHDKYNVVLGIFTTSYARATLYKYMERVSSLKEGHKLLYTDTDSIIFLAPRDVALPFVEGSSLGQMKEEHPNHDVISFYRHQTLSGGAKQYGLELRDRKTGEISYILKCRGLTLDSANEDHFNYKRFKQMINDYGKSKNENIVTLERDRFRPNWRRGEVLTQNCQISYSPIYDKGLVDANLDVYPFGYVGMAVEDPLRLLAGPEYNIKHE